MRPCANPACSNTLDGRRADAKYCAPTCSREARRGTASARAEAHRAEGFWSGLKRFRAWPSYGRRHVTAGG